jgi:hypothetical protein
VQRLKHSELQSLSEALLELYSPGPHADFPARVSAILGRCLSFDCLAYHEIVDNENQRAICFPEIPFDTQAFVHTSINIPPGTPLRGTTWNPV